MAQRNDAIAVKPPEPVPPPANDAGELDLADLARAVLTREIKRPRIADVRRLAEAVLAAADKRARKKSKKGGKKKLAKIPGQKGKK